MLGMTLKVKEDHRSKRQVIDGPICGTIFTEISIQWKNCEDRFQKKWRLFLKKTTISLMNAMFVLRKEVLEILVV